jgi:hypothetical protein
MQHTPAWGKNDGCARQGAPKAPNERPRPKDRTVTITTTNWRASLAALLATGVLLLGACSDGDEDADEAETSDEDQSDAADTGDEVDEVDEVDEPTIDPDAPEADSEFCEGAIAAISMEVDPEAAADDASLAAAEDLDPPDAIAEEWARVLATSRAMAEIDYTDPAAQEQASAAYEEIADDQAKVISYLQSDCGIDLGTAPPPSDPEVTTGG